MDMSYVVAARAKQKLNTEKVTVDVLGGEEDYTEDSYGFMNVDNGLKSSYALTGEPTGECNKDGLNWAIYLPGIEIAVAWDEKSNFNTITEKGVMSQSRDMKTTVKPDFYYQLVDNKPAYVMITGGRFAVLPDITYAGVMQYGADCGVFHEGRLFLAYRQSSDLVRWSGFDYYYDKKGPVFSESVDGGGRGLALQTCGKVTTLVKCIRELVKVAE